LTKYFVKKTHKTG